MTEFFRQIEADQVSHSDKTYLAHAIGVYNDLRAWGADEDVCNAGLFHSIYGTEIFQSFTLPVTRRDEVRELIGDEAEGLAFWNCFMDRSSFDRHLAGSGPYVLRHRETGEEHELSSEQYEKLCTIHLCDWLEQVGRSKMWDYRRDAYRGMAERLQGVAMESYERVFALEQAS